MDMELIFCKAIHYKGGANAAHDLKGGKHNE